MDAKGSPGSGYPPHEIQLIQDCQAGHSEQFVELVSPYLQSIKLIAYSALQNQHDMEEVVQETILKAFTHIRQLREGQNFRAWLLAIAANEARMHYRKTRKYLCDSLEEEVTQELDKQKPLPRELVDWRNIPSQELEQKEIRAALAAAFSNLGEGYREVFVLRDVEHLSIMQTAQVLGLSQAAVQTRLHRARLEMREQLTPLLKAPGSRKARMMSVNMMRVMGHMMTRKTISCRHVMHHVSSYIDAQLPPELFQQIEQHLQICHRCSILVDTMRKLLFIVADDRIIARAFECKIKWKQIREAMETA